MSHIIRNKFLETRKTSLLLHMSGYIFYVVAIIWYKLQETWTMRTCFIYLVHFLHFHAIFQNRQICWKFETFYQDLKCIEEQTEIAEMWVKYKNVTSETNIIIIFQICTWYFQFHIEFLMYILVFFIYILVSFDTPENMFNIYRMLIFGVE